MTHSFILIKNLVEGPYSGIVGYPHATPRQIKLRIAELDKLGIDAVSFTGPTSIGSLDVLGKGYVGIVVLAKKGTKKVALKIRRTDSPRKNMKDESALLKKANTKKVGPKFYDSSKNFLVMEYVKGENIRNWVKTVRGRGSVAKLKFMIKKILEDCYRLDQLGLDHGELSSISKHVIIGKKHALIDFESSSTQRKVSNVTSATQAIFIGSGISKSIRRIYRIPEKQDIIDVLRAYKKHGSRQNFEVLLNVLKL